MERNDTHDEVPISAWELALNDQSDPRTGKLTAAAIDKALNEHKSRHIEKRRSNEEDMIA